jgi:hypothetical protein
VTCSGTPQPAKYKITGENNASVKITAPAVTLLNGSASLVLNMDLPGTAGVVTLGNSSSTLGTEFDIGGNITVDGNTVDGTYVGNLNVTVEYN